MNRIRELRKQMNMTQKELATHLQVADSTLSYWEVGRYEPDSETLMKLSRFFRVPIDYILGGNFTRWDITENNMLYPDVESLQLNDSGLTVSEPDTEYNVTTAPAIVFDRIEFENLASGEIDMLAEYAMFIKSRRKK